MKLVVDANVLFALAKSSSVANSLISKYPLKLISPDFAILELAKHKQELLNKSDIKSFEKIIELLKKKVIFIDKSEYSESVKKLSEHISDSKDIAYLALAVLFKTSIWSNDKHFKEQSLVDVFTTKELIEFLG